MKKKEIYAIVKNPGEPAVGKRIKNELRSFQELVGGYIETVTPGLDWTIICNEEGRILKQPYNVEFCGIDFVGPIVLVGVRDDEFTDFPIFVEELMRVTPELFEEE